MGTHSFRRSRVAVLLALLLTASAVSAPAVWSSSPAQATESTQAGAPPDIVGPQDVTVDVGETAVFSTSIDRTASWSWLSKAPGAAEFSPLSLAKSAVENTVSISATAAMDGMQVEVRYTVDGADLLTEPATLHVVTPGAPIVLHDSETSVGGRADFTVNADSSVIAVKWQSQPAESTTTAWTDVAEDADHVGTATRTLELSGGATALSQNGRHFRAVLTFAATVRARAANHTTNSATLVVDNVTITVPVTAEWEQGRDLQVNVGISTPASTRVNVVTWSYSKQRPLRRSWTDVACGHWGVEGCRSNPLVLRAANVKSWNDWYVRALVLIGNTIVWTPPIYIGGNLKPVDQTVPVDATVTEGQSARFAAAVVAPPYLSIRWETKSPAAGSSWQPALVGPAKDLTSTFVIAKTTIGDNGLKVRPVYETAVGFPHPGREATLTVKPFSTMTGIYRDPTSGEFRYYVRGIDQDLPTGIDDILGRQYYVIGGAIQLGAVASAAVPGGHALFTLDGGMARDTVVYDRGALRYYDDRGALKADAGRFWLDDKEYIFDSGGRGAQIISEKKFSAGGPGGLLLRILEVNGVSTAVQFVQDGAGPLGPAPARKYVVTVGTRKATFTSDDKASRVAAQLNLIFANHAGQPTMGDISVSIADSSGATIVSASHAVTCPAAADSPSPRVIPTTCIPSGVPPTIEQTLQRIWEPIVAPVAGMTGAQLTQDVGATLGVVRDNQLNWVMHSPNFDGIGATAQTMAAHYDPVCDLSARVETTVVAPVVRQLHLRTRVALREELREVVHVFNTGDADATAARVAEVRAALLFAENELENDLIARVRDDARSAVVAAMPPHYPDYEAATNAAFITQLSDLGEDDPAMVTPLQFTSLELNSSNWAAGTENETDNYLRVARYVLDEIERTPTATATGPTTLVYQAVEDAARSQLNIPPLVWQ